MLKAKISETSDGRYIVQIPNAFGGLYPLIGYEDDCRSTATCFAKIQEAWLDGWIPEPVEITFLLKDDSRNEFTN